MGTLGYLVSCKHSSLMSSGKVRIVFIRLYLIRGEQCILRLSVLYEEMGVIISYFYNDGTFILLFSMLFPLLRILICFYGIMMN
jgi:hypothetical protein